MNPKLSISILAATIVSAFGFPANAQLIDPVRSFVGGVEESVTSLTDDRKQLLNGVVDYVLTRAKGGTHAKLVFICTHNSRRSHLAQIWCQTAAAHYSVPGVETYSGGTEATACNIRTVHALRRAGLSAVASSQGDNPTYLVQYSDLHPPIRAFSKIFSARCNPTSGFAAILCCSQADKQCPVVSGADGRFSLQYEDPKLADGTPEEAMRYDDRSFQIAQEMFYVMLEVSKRLNGCNGDSKQCATPAPPKGDLDNGELVPAGK
ncbi:protein-tyrosine-phosphatase [Rosistilla oblonga]|uniref:Protein ArsC n=1 Tax=Rosistilla oblonga TaxID=2527990 RepID=A0A518IPA4_9BACT|nr:protein-tyrosine-phosphatase [Rosistilla oblonga]QDV54926.1 Protein ArsC [Rosistilla oblonga]